MSMLPLQRAFLTLSLSCLALGCADADAESTDEPLAQVTPSARPIAPGRPALPTRPTRPELPELPAAATTRTTIDFPVVLRESGSATIHATVFSNLRAPTGKTVLAVHGLSETGTTFGPLASALFGDRELGRSVRRVVAIDMVGHGGSSLPRTLPNGALFGDLTIDDNVAVIAQALVALRARALGPDVIVGHSMGGLGVQAVQERLLAQGTSLAKLGVAHAILLAPVPPHARPWTQPVTGDTSAFVQQDPALGTFFSLPPVVWVAQAFTTTKGVQVANAPTVEQVTTQGYSAREPITTLLQLTEAPLPQPDGSTFALSRPSVRAGAFAAELGTKLTLVSFSEDTLVPAANLADLATHLTGDESAASLSPIVADDAVHSGFISNPTAVVNALRSRGL